MQASVPNRLLGLGILWGLLLAVLPFLVMVEGEITAFHGAAVLWAAVSGALGTFAAGRRTASGGKRRPAVAVLGTGLFQGLFGGLLGALGIWVLTSLALLGFSLGDLSALMRPTVFLGSFFVALSVFAYALAGGILLSPVFGTLINRLVRGTKEEKSAE